MIYANFELCKQLHDLGIVRQNETEYSRYYFDPSKGYIISNIIKKRSIEPFIKDGILCLPAWRIDELWDALPNEIQLEPDGFLFSFGIEKKKESVKIWYDTPEMKSGDANFALLIVESSNLPDALASMRIKLKEKGLM